jgi:hypothetical protein
VSGAPVYQPEVAARAVVFAAHANRREIWVSFSTLVAIMANRIAPAFVDRYLAKNGYSGQLMDTEKSPQAPSNLFDPVQGHRAHGEALARRRTPEISKCLRRNTTFGFSRRQLRSCLACITLPSGWAFDGSPSELRMARLSGFCAYARSANQD